MAHRHNAIAVAAAADMGVIGMKIFADAAYYHKDVKFSNTPDDVYQGVGSPELPSRELIRYALSVEGVSVLTFNHLLARTDFVRLIGEMLRRLEKAYGQPLDTEFTASIDAEGKVRINLLQCRPMRLPGATGPVAIPGDIPPERLLFRSSRTISGGVTPPIRYILFIDPARYGAIGSPEVKKSLGRIVGRINEHPAVAEGRILMMGPGRWGSSNIDLGNFPLDNRTIVILGYISSAKKYL